MRSVLILSVSMVLACVGCGKGGDLTAGEVGGNPDKYKGKKVKVTGVYTQGFSKGGRPADPWAVVIKDDPKAKAAVNCLVPARVEIKGTYPKITAEGTVSHDVSGGGFVYLNDCTYKVE